MNMNDQPHDTRIAQVQALSDKITGHGDLDDQLLLLASYARGLELTIKISMFQTPDQPRVLGYLVVARPEDGEDDKIIIDPGGCVPILESLGVNVP